MFGSELPDIQLKIDCKGFLPFSYTVKNFFVFLVIYFFKTINELQTACVVRQKEPYSVISVDFLDLCYHRRIKWLATVIQDYNLIPFLYIYTS